MLKLLAIGSAVLVEGLAPTPRDHGDELPVCPCDGFYNGADVHESHACMTWAQNNPFLTVYKMPEPGLPDSPGAGYLRACAKPDMNLKTGAFGEELSTWQGGCPKGQTKCVVHWEEPEWTKFDGAPCTCTHFERDASPALEHLCETHFPGSPGKNVCSKPSSSAQPLHTGEGYNNWGCDHPATSCSYKSCNAAYHGPDSWTDDEILEFFETDESMMCHPEMGDGHGHIDIPFGIHFIPEMAFAGCPYVKSVHFPECLLFIGAGAFMHTNLAGDITIPDSTIEVGDEAFLKLLIPWHAHFGGSGLYGRAEDLMFRQWDLTTPPPTTEDADYMGGTGNLGTVPGKATGPCHRHGYRAGPADHQEHSGRPCPFDPMIEEDHFELDDYRRRRELHPRDTIRGEVSAEPYYDKNGETWVWRDPTRTDVHIGSSVNYIGNEAFAWLMAEGGDVHFADDSSLLQIGHGAFACAVVSSGFHLPDSVEWIGDSAFHLVHGGTMKWISFIDALDKGFSYLQRYSGATLPSMYTSVYVQQIVKALWNVYPEDDDSTGNEHKVPPTFSEIPDALSPIAWEQWNYQAVRHYRSVSPADPDPKYHPNWQDENHLTGPLHLGKNLEYVGEDAFSHSFFTGHVTIPPKLETFGRFAFAFMHFASGLTFLSSPRYISLAAFAHFGEGNAWDCGCSFNYHTFDFDNCHYAGHPEWCPYKPPGATTLTGTTVGRLILPDSVEMIGHGAFFGAAFSGEVVVPYRTDFIGLMTFARAEHITKATILGLHRHDPICNHPLIECSCALERLWFRSSGELGGGILGGGTIGSPLVIIDTSLDDCLHVPNAIWPYAFAHALRLEEVHLPHDIRGIGPKAFDGAVSLKRINIPPTTEHIGQMAFRNCHQLETVAETQDQYMARGCTFQANLQHIGAYAFENTFSLKKCCVLHDCNQGKVIMQGAFRFCGFNPRTADPLSGYWAENYGSLPDQHHDYFCNFKERASGDGVIHDDTLQVCGWEQQQCTNEDGNFN